MESEVAVTLSCEDQCPRVSAKARQDWETPDPKNLSGEAFRGVRDLIESEVKDLLAN